MKTLVTLLPVVAAALVFQYLASTEKLPLEMIALAIPCCVAAVVLVRSIPKSNVAMVVGVVGTKSMVKLLAGVVVAVFAALIPVSDADEKRTLKVPAPPPEMQDGAVGFTKKVVLWKVSFIGPAAVKRLTCAVDTVGTVIVRFAVAFPVAVAEKPRAQVAADITPFAVRSANALPAAKVKTADARRVLDRFFI